MTSVNRRPLAPRPSQSLVALPSPARSLKPTLSKRPRSPDPVAHNIGSLIKRHKPTVSSAVAPQTALRKDRKPDNFNIRFREQQKAEREQQRLEFKEKYTRAFPSWTFLLDSDFLKDHQVELLQSRIQQLGGKVTSFFDRDVTHVISNRSVPNSNQLDNSEKENDHKLHIPLKPVQVTKSPLKTRTRQHEDQDQFQQQQDLLGNAVKFGKKIWTTVKLESVLSRCLDEPVSTVQSVTANSKQRSTHSLSKLLQSERIHGPSERDPTQRRHDFRYFTRGSFFVLIEDMNGELATIAAHEYPAYKEREGERPPWPTLYCHPCARGPFILFDDKEKRRWERLHQAEEKESEERRLRCETLVRRQLMEKRTDPRLFVRKAGDLRRSVSMNNMRNIAHDNPMVDYDGDGDAIESANPSGYLASGFMGYMAASGNSVGITSNTGTTSTANYTSRNLQIPSNLTERMRQEVVMRRQPQERLGPANTMGPPAELPHRTLFLKKSRSTNTLKLPKREEGSKPGYCESCRQKFEDFKEHINGRKHRKFAEDNNNFKELDKLLVRIQRRTVEERRALHEPRRNICHLLRDQELDSEGDSILVEDEKFHQYLV